MIMIFNSISSAIIILFASIDTLNSIFLLIVYSVRSHETLSVIFYIFVIAETLQLILNFIIFPDRSDGFRDDPPSAYSQYDQFQLRGNPQYLLHDGGEMFRVRHGFLCVLHPVQKINLV